MAGTEPDGSVPAAFFGSSRDFSRPGGVGLGVGTRREQDDRVRRAVLAVVRRRRGLREDGTPVEEVVGIQVEHGWVCASRLVARRSCCGDDLPWSAGHVTRRFAPDSAMPIGLGDRRHDCGRVPDAVEVTEQYVADQEALEDFAERVADELEAALVAARTVTRARHRGSVVARSERPPEALGRRDFNLRTLDL